MFEEPLLLKIAHISDLHFSAFALDPIQLFSKQWIGSLNLLLNRGRIYKNEQVHTLSKVFEREQVSHVLIAGDLTTIASVREFDLAKDFIDSLKGQQHEVFAIPGNHDSYTKKAFSKKLFYKKLGERCDLKLGFSLEEDFVSGIELSPHFWLVQIDSTHPCPFYDSTGLYTKTHDDNLRALLSKIPTDDHIMIMNHFPIFNVDSPRRRLIGADLLRKTLSLYSNVQLYLHGHTHRHCIADLRGNHLPIVLDSGSAAHNHKGTWNMLEIYPSGCIIHRYILDKDVDWVRESSSSFMWSYVKT